MKALVLSALAVAGGRGLSVLSALEEKLRELGLEAETIDVSGAHVLPCRACGSCSHKTPGRCLIKDDMQDVYPRVVASDVLVLATPIRFGAHHSALKRVLDRLQPLMVPFYVIRDGEMNWQPRYARRPGLLGVGLVSQENPVVAAAEGVAYRELIGRHASNLAAPGFATAALSTTDAAPDVEQKIRAALEALRISPARAGCVLG